MAATESQDLIMPTIHLNGTSRAELLGYMSLAKEAVRNAIVAVEQTAPNMRDFYPDKGRFRLALDQHMARLERLNDTHLELDRFQFRLATEE